MKALEMKPLYYAEQNARSHLETIKELVAILNTGGVSEGDQLTSDEVIERIYQYPLSIEVRASWHAIGETSTDDEYRLLLSTGGPACQLVGDLDTDGNPKSVKLQMQDWGTPWTNFGIDQDEKNALLNFAQQFYTSGNRP